ncbi:MAG: DNA-processing protein DprA [Rectinemataceae bacterium]|jgi:DNA processing protein
MKNIEEKRLVLALAIQRIGFLRAEERLLIWDLVDDELSLSLLLLRDVEAAIGRVLGGRSWVPDSFLEAAVRDARFLEKSGCRFIQYDDEAYPAALRETSRPPFGLFARGWNLDPAADFVAVVGTRLPTGRGLDAAFDLARGLTEAGVTVVSGLARGVDAAAHRGALAGAREGGTCAVLPCGIDRIYPPSNRPLAADILDHGGLLLSEYPPGEEIHKYRFPERNRIIAGLCRACVVVEAPAKSGALITAEHALDEGRDVWVAKDCLGGPRSAGIDRLAADGAQEADGAGDILADWGIEPGLPSSSPGARVEDGNEGRRLAAALHDELAIGNGR